MKRALAVSAALVATSLAPRASADGLSVPLDVVAAGAIKINGVLTDWPQAMTPLHAKVSGNPGTGADLAVRVALAFDDDNLYVAGDVTDDKLVRTASYGEGEDHLSLVIAFPTDGGGVSPFELNLFPGDPGNVGGAVFVKGSGKVANASLVEAPSPNKGGYTFEAKIPWSTFPPANKTRVGLRGVVRFHDSDGKGIKGVVGSSSESSPARMPRMPIDAERGIEEVLAKEKGLTGAPQDDVIADVTGDELRERVMRWDQFVIVCGPHFRGGKEFLFHDLAVDKAMIPSFEVNDVTGDGKAEIVVKKRLGAGTKWREVLQVLGVPSDAVTTLFLHEIGMSTDAGLIQNSVRIAGAQIEIGVGTSTASQATFHESPETSFDGALLPWGTIKSQTYKWDGAKFAKLKEESKPAGGEGEKPTKARDEGPPQPPPARPPTADELQDQLLALYKRDRKVGAKDTPRFDLAANVADDAQNERVLVFGRDLVVFGRGFLKGAGYVSLGVGFADAKDVLSVTTRDLSGDGRAEILVRGLLHVKAPKDLGAGVVDREVLLVYTVQDGKIVRVFGAETGMSLGDKRLTSTLAFLPTTKGTTLALGPGHAVGWDAKSYPYKQDTTPVGALEPLVLPWSEGAVRYAWTGSAFARLRRKSLAIGERNQRPRVRPDDEDPLAEGQRSVDVSVEVYDPTLAPVRVQRVHPVVLTAEHQRSFGVLDRRAADAVLLRAGAVDSDAKDDRAARIERDDAGGGSEHAGENRPVASDRETAANETADVAAPANRAGRGLERDDLAAVGSDHDRSVVGDRRPAVRVGADVGAPANRAVLQREHRHVVVLSGDDHASVVAHRRRRE